MQTLRSGAVARVLRGSTATFSSVTVLAEPALTPLRLSRLIQLSGIASRQEAERLIREGRVSVADEVVRYGGLQVERDKVQSVSIDNVKINVPAGRLSPVAGVTRPTPGVKLWLYNKIRGELCSFVPDVNKPRPIMGERIRVALPETKYPPGLLKPVERLDFQTEGLCLVTDNGAFARFLASDTLGLKRTLRLRINGKVTQEKLDGLKRGVHYASSEGSGAMVRSSPLHVSLDGVKAEGSNRWITVSSSAANHQRGLQATLGRLFLRPQRIICTKFGPFELPADEAGRVILPPGAVLEAKVPVDIMAKWVGRGYR